MTQDRLERIQLLSTRFLELQGLRVAFAGGTIALVFGSYLTMAQPTEPGAFVAMGISFVLMLPGELWLHQYYARTVGSQVPSRRSQLPTAIFFVVYFTIASYLNKRFPELPAGTPTMAIVVVFSIAIAVRDWPWRMHYLLVAAAVALAFASNVVGVEVIDRARTLSTTVLVAGLSLVPAGILDHRLLTGLLREVRQPEAANSQNS